MADELESIDAVAVSGCGCGSSPSDTPTSHANISGNAVMGVEEAKVEKALIDQLNAPEIRAHTTQDSLSTVSSVPGGIMAARAVKTPSDAISQSNQQADFSPSSQQLVMSNSSANLVTPSQAPSDLENAQLVYAIGTLGYDFGSEARRDTFKQLMPPFDLEGTPVPPNPYDARQMADYLGNNISEARSLIWTLNIELTPIYAIEPKGPFAHETFMALQDILAHQILADADDDYVERVSIPGLLSGRTVKLFSGQVVPVVEPQGGKRGIYGWKVNTLINAAMAAVRQETASQPDAEEPSEEDVRAVLESFLNRVYYDLRNLGTTSQDRALNYAVTNVFQSTTAFSHSLSKSMELDSITIEKSPFCRLDSDCWDVKLKFFDPENSRRAKRVYRYTIDVSDLLPVTLGGVKTWSSAY